MTEPERDDCPVTSLNKVLVTQPLMPDLQDYTHQLNDIWQAKWLSNGGTKHQLLEERLAAYMDAPNISLFNNGTIALMVAVQSLRLQGEVITTPFSFPATTHVLPWNNLAPVFADIDYDTMTLDPEQIERHITARTSGILGVHVYGTPCDTHAIQDIADRHGLRVIYDAAHAFRVDYHGRPIASYGDISMFSFHATKLFHTGEGGALVYNDPNLKPRIEYLKNFGIKNENEVLLPGINGKMNELQAALGLEVLPLVDAERSARAALRAAYVERLSGASGVSVVTAPPEATSSEQYFCIRVRADDHGASRDEIYDRLRDKEILARKYFHPLISDYPCYRALGSAAAGNLPNAQRVAREVLCLPFHSGVTEADVETITTAVLA